MVSEDDTAVNDYIFMKLGVADATNNSELNRDETIQAYMRAIEQHGYTWFSTRSLHTGMAKDKIKFYNQILKTGEVVKVLFFAACVIVTSTACAIHALYDSIFAYCVRIAFAGVLCPLLNLKLLNQINQKSLIHRAYHLGILLLSYL